MALKYTPEELQEHLNYEIKMLVGAWRRIHDGDSTISTISTIMSQELRNKIVANAAKETFCLHARSLMEFFCETRNRGNSAASFAVESYSPAQKNRDYKNKLNNQISHLLDGRISCWHDKINEGDRLEYLRWIATELERWKVQLDQVYCDMAIDKIAYRDLALMMLSETQPGATNVIETM